MNDVSDSRIGFDSDQNAVTLVTRDEVTRHGIADKASIADLIIDRASAIHRGGG